MMFRNDTQRGEVCRILVARLPGGPDRWFAPDEYGVTRPTQETLKACAKGSPISHGEMIMLRAALDVWSEKGEMKLGEALATLDRRNLFAIGELISCFAGSPERIDGWIKAYTEQLVREGYLR